MNMAQPDNRIFSYPLPILTWVLLKGLIIINSISNFIKYSNKRARKLCKRVGENSFSHATSTAKLRWKQIWSLLQYFSKRVQKIFEVHFKYKYYNKIIQTISSHFKDIPGLLPLIKRWLEREFQRFIDLSPCGRRPKVHSVSGWQCARLKERDSSRCSEWQNFSFVIGEFISGWSHAAWVKLMPCGPLKDERANDLANIEWQNNVLLSVSSLV